MNNTHEHPESEEQVSVGSSQYESILESVDKEIGEDLKDSSEASEQSFEEDEDELPNWPEEEFEDDMDNISQASSETGPSGTGEYIIKTGECISSIAHKTGHFWETIWNDSGNTDLRNVRSDPHVLLPGDRLVVPPLRSKEESGQTDTRHRFRRKGVPEIFRIVVLKRDEPRSNERYVLEIDGTVFSGNTDQNGQIKCNISGNAQRGKLLVGTGSDVDEYTLTFGDLDPLTEISGIQARLNNLGFPCGPVDGILGLRTCQALKRFQSREGLSITGRPDDATQQKLKEVHGC